MAGTGKKQDGKEVAKKPEENKEDKGAAKPAENVDPKKCGICEKAPETEDDKVNCESCKQLLCTECTKDMKAKLCKKE